VRIIAFPHEAELFDAHLDAIDELPGANGNRTDIVFTFASFQPQGEPEPCDRDGHPHERVIGVYVPMRLRFINAAWVRKNGIYEEFDTLPQEHGARRLFSILHSDQPPVGEFFWFTTGAEEPGELSLRAESYQLERLADPEQASDALAPVEIVRRWAPVPPPLPGYVPHRAAFYRRYGGDPITVRLGRRTYTKRLFIGGLHHQREERPAVHHVLNLCGLENPWCARAGVSLEDRYILKGEMAAGMDAIGLLEEAAWVADRLRAGRRVLVHCYAGVNRSTTVCCAALMLLERISAEEALARVRQHHPIAWPDPYHWFLLRWLSHALNAPIFHSPGPGIVNSADGTDDDPDARDHWGGEEKREEKEAPLLREEVPIR
jgi:hypothetical protein